MPRTNRAYTQEFKREAVDLYVSSGRPLKRVKSEAGFTSRNVERAEVRFDCGFTIDGEIFEAKPDEFIALTADRRITFVRA